MTTTVTVAAHCAPNKEVHVLVSGKPHAVLQNGEKTDVYAYDDRVISISEVLKPEAA